MMIKMIFIKIVKKIQIKNLVQKQIILKKNNILTQIKMIQSNKMNYYRIPVIKLLKMNNKIKIVVIMN